ncbi:MAG: metallophosphoesterase family protein [Bradyrhizobium sp.]|uniref:metallophosphoesterase family protein n=1 Tax=Bradyrhizobium sp. TaxID=376 RepID=UPI00391BC5D1
MRLAMISDVHGNLPALEAVLADIETRGVDATINLGDCVTGPLWPRETFALLEQLALPTVRGNHDRWIQEWPEDKRAPAGRCSRAALTAEQRLHLHGLPARIALEQGILAVHGTPDDDSACLLEEMLEDGRYVPARRDVLTSRLANIGGAGLVLCGHSHRQAVVQVLRGPLIVNPGSVGCPVFGDIPIAAQLEYRSPHARYAILTERRGHWQAELLALTYDWDRAAARAVENGFPNWASAYASGAVL